MHIQPIVRHAFPYPNPLLLPPPATPVTRLTFLITPFQRCRPPVPLLTELRSFSTISHAILLLPHQFTLPNCCILFLSLGNVKTYIILSHFLKPVLDLDPCLGVTCDFGLCKAFGPYDARCVCIDKCPSFQKPLCSSNGTTYDNECLFEQEMCLLRQNFTVQHPGSCEGVKPVFLNYFLGMGTIFRRNHF